MEREGTVVRKSEVLKDKLNDEKVNIFPQM
jgi:hypothetical protein